MIVDAHLLRGVEVIAHEAGTAIIEKMANYVFGFMLSTIQHFSKDVD